jgi:xanthine/CO dehydrogenase XdhC/CoxF family maturation factor
MNDWPRLLAFADRHPAAPLALATLVGRTGSSYRQPGARLLVTATGDFAGSLSGGCLEEDIAQVALRVLASGHPETLHIDTRPHFGCPGRLEIFLEPIACPVLDTLRTHLAARRPVTLLTDHGPAATGTRIESTDTPHAPSELPTASAASHFRETLGPRPRLLVLGWSRDAEAVCRQSSLLGWETVRIADSPARLRELTPVADEQLAACPPDSLLARFPPDSRTAVLVMTHHLGRDAAYLAAAFRAPYGYLGLLGSRRRREEIFHTLAESGLLDTAPPETLHAPVGLDIGAETPESIALAILAEIHALWQSRPATPLRTKTTPIHPFPAA